MERPWTDDRGPTADSRPPTPDDGRQTTDDGPGESFHTTTNGGRWSAVGGPFISALRVAPDDRLLLVTSRYRFLLTTARQLADLRGIGQNIENLYRFAAREAVCAIVNWTAAREMERLLLVTSTGYARAYPLDVLRPAIEAPTPLAFDNPLPGVPILAQGIARSQDVVIVTEEGRAVRWPLGRIPLTGVQALNPGRDEAFDRVNAALAVEPEAEIALLLADGYARRLRAEWIEEPPRANAKGKALVARRAAAVGLAPAGRLVVVTDRRLLAADGSTLPLEESTKTFRLVKVGDGESVTAVQSFP
jgi:DNA gyrase/topoisomerase IV subunit A